MKLAFYLTENRNVRDGVTHYASEIIKRAPKELECLGEAFHCSKRTKGRAT